MSYFRAFIKDFAKRAESLTNLLKKTQPWTWTQVEQAAWNDLKSTLKEEPVALEFPHDNREWVLDCDASGHSIGAMLQQRDADGQLHLISYASRMLTSTEKKWPIRELEAFSIVWSILHFEVYLRGVPHFLVRNDHKSLSWLWSMDKARIARWCLALQEFRFTIQHQSGKDSSHVDLLTRDVDWSEVDTEVMDRLIPAPKVMSVFGSVFHVHTGAEEPQFPSVQEIKDAQESRCVGDNKWKGVHS